MQVSDILTNITGILHPATSAPRHVPGTSMSPGKDCDGSLPEVRHFCLKGLAFSCSIHPLEKEANRCRGQARDSGWRLAAAVVNQTPATLNQSTVVFM